MNGLTWIRRDIRLHDHCALSECLKACEQTYLCFVFDPHILDKLTNKSERRLTFIIEGLKEIHQKLLKQKSSLYILYGKPEVEIPKLAKRLKVNKVFTNRDYEPYAVKRDHKVKQELKKHQVQFEDFKDHVFFEKHEVLTQNRGIYKVFTPYKNKWLELFSDSPIPDFKCNLKKLGSSQESFPDCYKLTGFKKTQNIIKGGTQEAFKLLKYFNINNYKEARDFPAIEGTSNLSSYIRHGNISIRDMIRFAHQSQSQGATTWLSELIWRDFYHMILATHPGVTKTAFRPEYDAIKWRGGAKEFNAWKTAKTGVPIIDAAMRCFNETGMMHNRLRMVVANFLCKILLVDWRKGEEYFAQNLMDFDLAANNGGWQWSSGSGCDAQPYFRIFNPYTQSEKFDPDGKFIKKWCPELSHLEGKKLYRPEEITPIVNYEQKRKECLVMYQEATK